jgi:hypothetical protein
MSRPLFRNSVIQRNTYSEDKAPVFDIKMMEAEIALKSRIADANRVEVEAKKEREMEAAEQIAEEVGMGPDTRVVGLFVMTIFGRIFA